MWYLTQCVEVDPSLLRSAIGILAKQIEWDRQECEQGELTVLRRGLMEKRIYLFQGALGWENTFHLAGDLHKLAVPRVMANLAALQTKRQTARR